MLVGFAELLIWIELSCTFFHDAATGHTTGSLSALGWQGSSIVYACDEKLACYNHSFKYKFIVNYLREFHVISYPNVEKAHTVKCLLQGRLVLSHKTEIRSLVLPNALVSHRYSPRDKCNPEQQSL